MRWLKILLAINGALYIIYGVTAFVAPTSFWVPAGSAAAVIDLVYAIGVAQIGFGAVQLGTWRTTERWAVELVAFASLFFTVAFGALLWFVSGRASDDMFHKFGVAGAAAWVVVGLLYLFLIYRERREA